MEIALGKGGPQLVQYIREGSTLLANVGLHIGSRHQAHLSRKLVIAVPVSAVCLFWVLRVILTVLLGATCAPLGLNPLHDHPTTSGINRGSKDELNSNTCYTISAEGLAMLTRNFYRSPPLRFDLGLIPTFNYYQFPTATKQIRAR